ncbi:MAG TPA: VOC family protein [Terriglobales bacterium]|jgi:predicted enzyme related to lactoylglutathione lyase|nr:VOC family protein [Terriglobales bacterium]
MLTKIQHFAIVSENFVREAKFFEAVFGMKRSKPGSEEEQKAIRTNYAVSISDGYVGVTVIGRKPGYVPGLHHFGVDVEDVDEAIARIKKHYPQVAALKRPSNRPFATYGAHDPEGNYFDLTQEGMSNRRDVYVEQERQQPRRVHHLKLRVMNAPAIAAFYRDMLDLREADKALEDPNFYLTDGRMTLIVAPWKMSDFEGAGIDRPGLEHVGFQVENLETTKNDLAALREADPDMRERIIAEPSEGERRVALIASCRHGQYPCSSPDGVFIDISERYPASAPGASV